MYLTTHENHSVCLYGSKIAYFRTYSALMAYYLHHNLTSKTLGFTLGMQHRL